MKTAKKIIAILISVAMIAVCFAGCSSEKDEKYTDTRLIIGYTDSADTFLTVKDGKAEGFFPELWEAIFSNVKGEFSDYTFEKIDNGYELEQSGGFVNESEDKEYSASLMMGAVSKNNGTFNEDYSFTEPIITDRIIAVTKANSKIKTFADFKGAKVSAVEGIALDTLKKNSAIYDVATVTPAKSTDDAIAMLDSGKADVVVTNELTFLPTYNEKDDKYVVIEKELDTIEYVIACAKYSGWKDSINDAISKLKSEEYEGSDMFTPIVEKYFGYNASSFEYESKNK